MIINSDVTNRTKTIIATMMRVKDIKYVDGDWFIKRGDTYVKVSERNIIELAEGSNKASSYVISGDLD